MTDSNEIPFGNGEDTITEQKEIIVAPETTIKPKKKSREKQNANLILFKKGVSGNPKGRPKNFDELRGLAKDIAAEIIPNSPNWTRAEVILRAWAASRDPRAQERFMQYAFGKVADEIKIDDNRFTDYQRAIEKFVQSGLESEASTDSEGKGELKDENVETEST